ncbi:hypothetical protein H7X46_00755 [Pseudonocardia sp. C8]|uniref:hypothetical protein n=1 Tax=Pseudonocardia sp. C8 TaxID=2762759 RepID=UPI0016433BB0|nr:hypothetical protein [Pseudonocardia sp. C8]MBC3189596.1 hypothetical protein [Pseudonocardia sp. C8]
MFEPPTLEHPVRVMIFGACRETWYAASDREREEQALPALRSLLDDWRAMGLDLIASFDDDYFLVGQPGSLQYAFFILAEVESVERLVTIVNRARTTVDGLRADRWFRFEARAGRRLFLLDN